MSRTRSTPVPRTRPAGSKGLRAFGGQGSGAGRALLGLCPKPAYARPRSPPPFVRNPHPVFPGRMSPFQRHIDACNDLASPAGLIPFRIGAAQVGWLGPDLARALTFFPRDIHFDANGAALAGRLRSPGARTEALAGIARSLAERGHFMLRRRALRHPRDAGGAQPRHARPRRAAGLRHRRPGGACERAGACGRTGCISGSAGARGQGGGAGQAGQPGRRRHPGRSGRRRRRW